MDDVAAAADVSRALVSLVMRNSDRVSQKSKAAVLEAAERLGYRPNLAARNLATGRTSTFGVLLDDLHNPWFADVADGIQDTAEAAGYQIVLASGRRSADVEDRSAEAFLAARVDGMILVSCRLSAARIDELGERTPVVSIGRSLRSDLVDTINSDERVGARLAVEHLFDLGHRRIAHLDGGTGASATPRRNGYVAAMRGLDIEAHIRVVTGEFTERAGSEAIDQLYGTVGDDEPPTALFAANDLIALGALNRLIDHGMQVPDDVSLVGYDNSSLAALRTVDLTTVDQPRLAMGNLAVELLLERRNGREITEQRVVSPRLVTRATTAPARRGSR